MADFGKAFRLAGVANERTNSGHAQREREALSWRIWRQSQSRTCHEIIIKTFLIVLRQIYTITYRLFKISILMLSSNWRKLLHFFSSFVKSFHQWRIDDRPALALKKIAMPNWDANSWEEGPSVDTNSLRHLPRRSSKNCHLQFANCGRIRINCLLFCPVCSIPASVDYLNKAYIIDIVCDVYTVVILIYNSVHK